MIRSIACSLALGVAVLAAGCASDQEAATSRTAASPAAMRSTQQAQQAAETPAAHADGMAWYIFWEGEQVYFAPDRGMYFWMADGIMQQADTLPAHAKVDENGGVWVRRPAGSPMRRATAAVSD